VCSECKPDYGTQTRTQTIKKWLKRKAVTWHICFTYNYWSDQVSWLLSLATLPISVQLSCCSAADVSQDWLSSLCFRTSGEQTGKVLAWNFQCTGVSDKILWWARDQWLGTGMDGVHVPLFGRTMGDSTASVENDQCPPYNFPYLNIFCNIA